MSSSDAGSHPTTERRFDFGSPLGFLVRLVVFGLVFAGVAEVWLRTVMPACEVPTPYQAQPATIYRFNANGTNAGLFTVGRLCRPGGQWRINNAGWNSAIDYAPAAQRQRPLMALFGDSYIEGFLTDADQHIDAYLPKMLPGTEAYAFGVSGWYLEQYTAVSRYVGAQFQPDVLLIFIDKDDVSDSIKGDGTPSPYWWQIAASRDSFREAHPTAIYAANRKTVLATKSAIVGYLRYNRKLPLPGMRNAVIPQPVMGSGTLAQGSARRLPALADSDWRGLLPAADYMVSRLCGQHPGTPIIFVAYSDCYLPEKEVAATPLFADGRAVEVASEGRPQCSFIDLRYAFSRDWAAHGVRFEAADGAHWNAYSNRLVARTLADFITEEQLLPRAKRGLGVGKGAAR